jgi:NAD(P)H-hydrate epimerase
MKILTATQFRQVDAFTIENEPIASIDLMERASRLLANEILERWDESHPVKVFAGPGNNGGDALAVSRMLAEAGREVYVWLFNTTEKLSDDCAVNRDRLEECPVKEFHEVTSQFTPPALMPDDIILDGLFGTGLSRPLGGGFAAVVQYINASASTVVSIDMPSGLMSEDNSYNVMNHIVKANYTFTFHRPKLAFFFSDMSMYVGEWKVLDIGEKDVEGEMCQTHFYTTDLEDVKSMLKTRNKFAHKGTMGHAALVAGKHGMAGAAILAAKACLRTGVGKITVHTPYRNNTVLQISVPEAVLHLDQDGDHFTTPFDANDYEALGIGPGIGTESDTAMAFIEQIRLTKSFIVIDADALNILGGHRGWIQQLPKHCILTPHKKELFGLISTTRNDYEELEFTRELAIRQQIYVIIKSAYSAVVTPSGDCYFNTTGNPGMATAGSGDVLTGIILSLLAIGYTPEQASRLGVYLHGLAGDCASAKLCEDSVIASDIIDNIPEAFRILRKKD